MIAPRSCLDDSESKTRLLSDTVPDAPKSQGYDFDRWQRKSQTPFSVSQTIIIHQYQEFNECIWFIKTTQVHQLQKIKKIQLY